MQSHAHPHRHAFWPDMGEEGMLGSHRSRDRIGGTRKGYEEGIALRIHLVTMELAEC